MLLLPKGFKIKFLTREWEKGITNKDSVTLGFLSSPLCNVLVLTLTRD